MIAESATEVAGELVFGTRKTHQQRTVPLPAAAMTLDVYSGLFDDDLTALAERMDAASRAAAEARVGAVWARPLTERSEKGKPAGQASGPRGDRTLNPRIKSPLLCQLS